MISSSLTPIGLDIGSRWIKAVQLRRGRGGLELVSAVRIRRNSDTPELSVAEAERAYAILRRNGFAGRDAVLSVPNQRLVRRVMELPPRESGAPLNQIVRAELARAGKCAAEAMEAAWWELPSGVRASEGTHIMAVACPHDVAEGIIGAVEESGLRVMALDTPATAIARACDAWLGVSPAPRATSESHSAGAGAMFGSSSVVTIVDLGWQGATIAVFASGLLAYERVLEGDGLRRAHEELRKNLDVEDDVAEYIVDRLGVAGAVAAESSHGSPFGSDQAELLAEAQQTIQGNLRAAVDEIRASVAYAARRFSGATAPTVLLCGGGMRVPGVVGLIRQGVGDSAATIVPSQCVTVSSASMASTIADDTSFIAAIGLARHDGTSTAEGT